MKAPRFVKAEMSRPTNLAQLVTVNRYASGTEKLSPIRYCLPSSCWFTHSSRDSRRAREAALVSSGVVGTNSGLKLLWISVPMKVSHSICR